MKQLFAEINRQSEVTATASGRNLQSPPTAVVQSRNRATRPRTISTDQDLQSFIDTQIGPTGLLKKYAKQFNRTELLKKLESGASFVTAEGAKPLDELASFYGEVARYLRAKKSRSKDKNLLPTQIEEAERLADNVRASQVPGRVVRANKATDKARSEIESFATQLRTKGFAPASTYLETVTQFIRGVGQNNESIRKSLEQYEENLLKNRITPESFQIGVAGLAKTANRELGSAQKNAEQLFKESVKANAGNYAAAYQQVFQQLLPSGITPTSGLVDQTVAGSLRQQLLNSAQTGLQRTAGRDLTIRRADFAEVNRLAGKKDADPLELAKQLNAAEAAVRSRIQNINNQLAALKSAAAATNDPQLTAAISAVEAQLQTTISTFSQKVTDEVQRINDKFIQTQLGIQPSKKSRQSDLASDRFISEIKTFDSTIPKLADILRGSTRNQSASVGNYVRAANTLDAEINNVIDNRFATAIDRFNDALMSQQPASRIPGMQVPMPQLLSRTLYRDILSGTGFFNQETTAGRVNALGQLNAQNIKAQVQAAAPTLTNDQLDVVTQQLIAQIQDLIQSYRVLDELVDKVNITRFAELRAAEELAISENRLADAQALRAQQEFLRGVVPTQATGPVTQANAVMRMGNLDANTLLGMGFSQKDVTNYFEDASRRDTKINRASQNERGYFERFSAFASRFGAVMGFLQSTIGVATTQLQQFLEQANEIERTASTVAAVSGSFEEFTNVVRVASIQQQKFGGSLNEQMTGFTSLVQITRAYNVDLEQLDNVARRLAIIDPLQGFSGAAIALKEFFSGDITSLSRRFEIDRKTLNSVKNVANEAERLQKLDDVLAGLGISNAVLEARAQSTAAEYDRLAGNFQNATALIGTALQEYFLPDATAISDWLNNFSTELSEVTQRRERFNEAFRGIASLSEEFSTLKLQFSEKPGSTYFDDLTISVNASTEAINELITKTNEYVAQINATRFEEGREPIPLFTQADRDFLVLFTQASQLGLNTRNILSARQQDPSQATGFFDSIFSPNRVREFTEYGAQDTQSIIDIADSMGRELPRFNSTLEMLIGRIPAGAMSQTNISQGAFGGSTTDIDINRQRLEIDAGRRELESELNDAVSQSLRRVGRSFVNVPLENQDANMRAQTALYQERYGFQDMGLRQYIQGREDKDYLERMGGPTAVGQVNALIAKERVDYLTATDPLTREKEFDQYLQILADIVFAQKEVKASAYDAFTASLPNPYTKFSEELGKIVKLVNDQSFGVERTASAVDFLNGLSSQYNDLLADAIIKQYELAKGGDETAMAFAIQRAELLGIVDTTDTATASTRAQLEAISRANRLRAIQTLEGEKSVSALQAMNAEANKFNLSMQQIVDLAVEFNSSLQNFTMGSILPLTSIQDQLSFRMDQLNPNSLVGRSSGPKNQEEAFSIAGQAIGLISQISQDGGKTGDELADLHKKYLEDLADEEKSYQEDMKELADQYYEDMKKLQEESEITKRGNKADFYESLFGMDLTNEQRASYIDQFKAYEAEATKLRGEGKFTAAQELLDAGSQQILNQAKYDTEVLDNKEEIKKSDEEIAQLNKDMANAKDSDDRAEIQRKIDAANQDKLNAENRIKQIEGLRVIRADADREEVEQARKKEEQITTDFKTESAKREQDYKDKLAEMDKAYNKSVEDRKKGDNAATKQEIANKNLVIELEVYRTKVNQLARLISMGASDQAIKNQQNFVKLGEKRILDIAGPELKPVFEELFTSLKTLEPSSAQAMDPLVREQLDTTVNNTAALVNNTTALTNFVTTLGRVVVGDRLRVTFQP